MSEDTNTTQEEAPAQCIPFDTSLMMKDDMFEHLFNFHGVDPYSGYGNSKRTKDQMVVLHMRCHDEGDRYYGRMKIAHNHTALPEPTEAQMQALTRANNPLGKALNAAERKALNDLVNNDFAVLRTEIDQFASDMLQQRLAEIEAEYADKEVDLRKAKEQAQAIQKAYTDAYNDLNEKFRKQKQDLIESVKLNGIGLSFEISTGYQNEPSVELQGRKDAIAKAKAEVEADKARARNTLERQRLSNQRKVLMLGVSQDGLEVLDTMPDARQLMVEAAGKRPEAQAIDA